MAIRKLTFFVHRKHEEHKDLTKKREKQSTKVLFKKLFVSGYQTREAWVEEFDNLVASYDELRHEYEKQLQIESNIEYELEKCIENIENEKKNQLQMDAPSLTKNVEILNNQAEEVKQLKIEIEQMKNVIEEEKSRFKSVIEEAKTRKVELHKSIERTKNAQETKLKELRSLEAREEQIKKDIEKSEKILEAQGRVKERLIAKINDAKNQ